MKKFVALVVLSCAVMFSSTVTAEMQPVQIYDQNVSTLIQRLQKNGIKIWNIEYRNASGYSGYEAHFGDNPNNQLAVLVNNDGAVSALGIVTQCPLEDDSYFKTFQVGEVWGATLLIVGLTQDDLRKIVDEYFFSVSNAIKQNPYLKRYQKTFSAYSVQTKRLIVSEVFMEEIRPGIGEFRIFMRAYL